MQGKVRITSYSIMGKQVSFRDLTVGQSFGDLAAIDGRPRSATAVAISDTLLASMSAQTYWHTMMSYPPVAAACLRRLTTGAHCQIASSSMASCRSRRGSSLNCSGWRNDRCAGQIARKFIRRLRIWKLPRALPLTEKRSLANCGVSRKVASLFDRDADFS